MTKFLFILQPESSMNSTKYRVTRRKSFYLYCLSVLCFLPAVAQTNSGTEAFFAEQQERLGGIRDLFRQRFDSNENFQCRPAYHFCGADADPDSQCVYTGHDHGVNCSTDSCEHIEVPLLYRNHP